MSDDLRRRAEVIFQHAADLPPATRSAYLDQACGGDNALREEVLALLAYLDLGDKFLEQPLIPKPGRTRYVVGAPLPERFGNYRVMRLLGEGGMGIVYEAEQDNPRRVVALKVIRPGQSTRAVLSRFQKEAHILGQLRHAGIAQIYEAGTVEAGHVAQPYFAMELVDGPPVTEFVERHGLGTRDRLEVFARICDAVQYAHGHGVIHRDLKPGNILVLSEPTEPPRVEASRASDSALGTQHSALSAQPKILDFGVARVTNTDVDTVTLQTDVGQLVGTISYMSPEQVAGDPKLIDRRSDVYSLGVVLYELLAGRLPHDVRGISIPEAARIIRENDPSRLSSINPVFRGDIETIVAKAMEKDPARRYQSAAELAVDIRHYLCDEPIIARPTSAFYQFRKFARRNRGVVWAASAAFVILILGVIGFWWRASREAAQRVLADQNAAIAQRQAYLAGIAAAQMALQGGDVGLARRSLAAAPEALRGWEWKYLNWLSDRSLVTLRGHKGALRGVEFSRDDLRIATAGDDGVRVWDARTGECQHAFPTNEQMDQVAFSPDDRHVLALHVGHSSAVWSLETGRQLWRRPGRWASVAHPFKADGSVLALDTRERPLVELVDVQTGRIVSTFSKPGPSWIFVGFSPRDHDRALISLGSLAQLIDVNSGAVQCTAPAYDPRFTPDGGAVLSSERGETRVYDAQSGQPISLFPVDAKMDSSGIAPNARSLVTCEPSGAVRFWNPGSRIPVWSLLAHDQASSCAFSHDGTRLATASLDGLARVWDSAVGSAPASFPMLTTATAIAFSPTVDRIAMSDWGRVRLVDAATGRELWTAFLSRDDDNPRLAFSPDGLKIAVAVWDSSIRWLDSQSGALLQQLPLPDYQVIALDHARPGPRLLASDGGEDVVLIDPATAGILGRFGPLRGSRRCAAVSMTADLLAAGDESGQLRVWRAGTGEPMLAVTLERPIVLTAFSPDASRLAVADDHHVVTVFDMSTLAIAARLTGVETPVKSVVFAPDGTRIAAGCAEGKVHLWDAQSGQHILLLHAAADASYAVAYTPDLHALYCGGGGASITAFEIGPPACVTLEREHVRQARTLVHSLFKEVTFSRKVADRLRLDAALDEPLREAALQIALACGDHLNAENSSAWGAVRFPGNTREEHQRALDKIAEVCRIQPNNADFVNTFGVARYRLGEFAAAHELFEQCLSINRAAGKPIHPIDLACLAMTSWRLDHRAMARQYLEQARAAAATPQYAVDEDVQHFVDEAQRLLSGSAAP